MISLTDLNCEAPNITNQSLISFQKTWLELCSVFGDESFDDKFTQVERDCYQFVFLIANYERRIIDLLELKLKLNSMYFSLNLHEKNEPLFFL